MRRHVISAVFSALIAGVAAAGPGSSPAEADGCSPGVCLFTVPMTVTPTTVVVGQSILAYVYVGSDCANGWQPMHFYATTQTSPVNHYIDLGYWGMLRYPPNNFWMHTNVLPVGVWHVYGSEAACFPLTYPSPTYELVTNGVTVTVKPAPAAPAPPKQATPQIKPASLPPPVTIPTVHIQTSMLAPVPANFHTVAALEQPSLPSAPGGGALAGLVAAAVAAVSFGALWRRRSRQHR